MGHLSVFLFLGLGFSSISLSEAGSHCAQLWNNLSALPTSLLNETVQCPFGSAISKVDVTIPLNATFFDWVCVVYGIIPFVVIGFAFLETILRACCHSPRGLGTRETSFLVFFGIQVLLGELVFKNIISQARPVGSCALTCGMPSSHATMSVGFFMLMFFDAIHRVMPAFPRDLETAQRFTRSREQECCCGYTTKDLLLSIPALLNFVPITDYHTLKPHSFAVLVVFWGTLLLPVGFTRVALMDHSPEQVTFGSIIGFLEAVAFFSICRHGFQKKLNHLVGKRMCCLFIHNYAVPVFEAVGNGWNMLADLEDYDEDTVEADGVERLAMVRSEVEYYLKKMDPDVTCLLFDEETPALDYQAFLLKNLDQAVEQELKRLGHAGEEGRE